MSAPASGSSDPYAPFYYWDAQTTNWAFDYNSYYATYGYPEGQQYQNGGYSAAPSSSYSQHQQQSYLPSQPYQPPAGPSVPYQPIPSGASAAPTDAPAEKPKKHVAGPKDEQGNPLAGNLKRGDKRTTVIKRGPDGAYEDATLLEWNPDHKRLFVGDLGNDVSDQILHDAFARFKSLSKSKVIRKKHDQKSRGYGFVAFADPEDFLKAWKEMNGKYIGSRPCRLKAAESEVKQKEIGFRQDRQLANNMKHQEFKAKYKMGGAVGGQLRRHGVGKVWASK